MFPWTFTGQPSSEWPRLIFGTNYAANWNGTRIIVHQFEGKLEIEVGDVVNMKLTGEFFVEGRPEALKGSLAECRPIERDGQRMTPTGLWLPPGAHWAELASSPELSVVSQAA